MVLHLSLKISYDFVNSCNFGCIIIDNIYTRVILMIEILTKINSISKKVLIDFVFGDEKDGVKFI